MKEITSWSMPARRKWPSNLTINVKFTGGVNLRGPILDGGWFSRASLKGCLFEQCDLGAPLFTKLDMNGCVFDEVKFGTSVAVWKDVQCTDCKFSRSALAHITFESCQFTNVEFIETNFGDLRFMRCSFERVITRGVKAHSVTFVEGAFKKSDFSNTQMADCSIVKCNMDSTAWPDRKDCFLVMPQSLSVVAKTSEGKITTEDQVKLAHLSSLYGQSTDPLIWDESLIEELNPNSRELVMGDLYAHRIRQGPSIIEI
jgi:hypothetical protein